MSREIPYKIYLEEKEMPKAVVQCPGRYEEQARPPVKPGDLKAHGL